MYSRFCRNSGTVESFLYLLLVEFWAKIFLEIPLKLGGYFDKVFWGLAGIFKF